MFASELKALRAYPGWNPEPDRDAMASYFRFNYVPEPHSIYRGVKKLPPGSMLTWEPGGGAGSDRALLEHARLRESRPARARSGRRRWRSWTSCCATRSGGR